jgi:hypothetical protein
MHRISSAIRRVRVELFNAFYNVNYGNPGPDVRCGDVRAHQLRRKHAANAVWGEIDLLKVQR